MSIPLEDNFTDIIGKAQRGLGLSDSQLAEKSGASLEAIRELREKIDHLLRKQYNRLFEIQQIQIELLEELGQKRRGGKSPGPGQPT